jgi:1-deoxy-D-xylulose-5-phosphate reductoisomerase
MHAGKRAEVRRVYLTASGGPFRTWSAEQMAEATVEDALNHPTWDMGPKISIDSATMMNKALEIVEAHWLFGLEPEQIVVLAHPESVVHAMVEFADGSVIGQMGEPDMRTPIQYALTYPARLACPSARLDFGSLRSLTFEPPDQQRFPSLRLAYEVVRQGGLSGAVLNAANEAAVELFRSGAIRFPEIVELTEQALARHEPNPSPTLEDLLTADRWAREEVARCTTC